MSIGSFFGSIGHVLGGAFTSAVPKIATTANIASVVVGAFNPPLGAVLAKLGGIVAAMETAYTTAKAGVQKRQTAAQIAVAEIPQLEEVVSAFGANVAIPQAELGEAIDAVVNANNKVQALVQAIEAANKKPAAIAAPAK